MIDRDEACVLLHNYVQDDKLRKHSYAVEAIMHDTAVFLKKDHRLWGLVGLLHDIDYEYTQNDPQKHGLVSGELLNELLPDTAIYAIKAHNFVHTRCLPVSDLDKALIAADALSGLIIAAALVMPQKQVSDVSVSTLSKKMKDAFFARGCDRKRIRLCEDIGLELDRFLSIGLDALKRVRDQLDL